jgi:hypothetical protein
MIVLFVIFFIQGVVFGGFCSFVAKEKGRNNIDWFILGFLFSLVALIAICGVGKPEIKDAASTKTKSQLPAEELDIEFS